LALILKNLKANKKLAVLLVLEIDIYWFAKSNSVSNLTVLWEMELKLLSPIKEVCCSRGRVKLFSKV
jgi:hypothetical protein